MNISPINNTNNYNSKPSFKAVRYINTMPSNAIHERAVTLLNDSVLPKNNFISRLFPKLSQKYRTFKNHRALENDAKLVQKYRTPVSAKVKTEQDVQEVWNEFISTDLPHSHATRK